MAVESQRKTLAADTDIDTALLKTSATTIGNGGRRSGAAVRETPRSIRGLKPKQKLEQDESEDTADDKAQKLQDTVSQFIETVEVQAAIVFLVVFDLCSTVLSRHLRMTHELLRLDGLVARAASTTTLAKSSLVDVPVTTTSPSLLFSIMLRLLDSLSGFTVVLFVLELAVLAFTFRRRFFSHFGYMLDLIVVCTSIVMEIYTESQAVRLLGLLRVWRLFRLVGTLLEQERRLRDRTLEELELERTRVLQLQYEKHAAEQSLKREFESRAGMERMLQGYKDEADTLREALNIAALAVAEATMTSDPTSADAEYAADQSYEQPPVETSNDGYGVYYGEESSEPTATNAEEQYHENWTKAPSGVEVVEDKDCNRQEGDDDVDSDQGHEAFLDANDE